MEFVQGYKAISDIEHPSTLDSMNNLALVIAVSAIEHKLWCFKKEGGVALKLLVAGVCHSGFTGMYILHHPSVYSYDDTLIFSP